MTTDGYRQLIEHLVRNGKPFTPTRESPGTVQVERGSTVLVDLLAGRVAGPSVPIPASVVDATGHRRPVYRPLLAHAFAVASHPPDPTAIEHGAALPLTAANGAAVAAAAWAALAQTAAGRPTSWFDPLVASQQPNGALLRATSADNPETHWYHELVILHALANGALRSGDARAWAAVERATLFHLNETETDHATGQPWGLPAFVRVAGAGPLADGALHAVSAHQPGGAAGVALLLLADTLYGLRHLPLPPETRTR